MNFEPFGVIGGRKSIKIQKNVHKICEYQKKVVPLHRIYKKYGYRVSKTVSQRFVLYR